MKSHTGFPLVPEVAILNDVRMAVILFFILRYSTELSGPITSQCLKIYAVCYENVAQRIYFLTIYSTFSHSQRLLRKSALERGTPMHSKAKIRLVQHCAAISAKLSFCKTLALGSFWFHISKS